MHGDIFYPLAAIQFILPIHRALGYKLVITVFLAGVFAYLYFRQVNFSKWSAVFGGTAYMLSGFLVSLVYAGHDGRMYVTSLLPFLLFTMEIGFMKRTIIWWWPFAAAFALLVMANHPQFAYFCMWCVGAYFLLRIVFLIKEEKIVKVWMTPIIGFVLAMVFGLCLSLVAIWPNQDYVRKYSPRSGEGRGFEYAASWGLHAEEAFSQIVPGFSGYSTLSNHPGLSAEQTYWGKNYFKINSEYAGMVAIILGIVGLFIYRDRFSYFFLGVAIFSLLYALGSSGFVFKIFYNMVPFVNKFRAPSTIMFLFAFAVTFLGARTVDFLEKHKKVPHLNRIMLILLILGGIYLLKGVIIAGAGMGVMKIYTSVFHPKIEPGQLGFLQDNLPNITGGLILGAFLLATTAGLIWGHLHRKMSMAAVAISFIGLVLIDSWIINDMKFIRTVDHEPYFAKPPVAVNLERQPKPFRALALPQTLSNQNLLAQFGIEQTTGYHGNQLRWFDEFIGGPGQSNIGRPSVISLTNSTFVLSREALNSPIIEPVASTGGLNVYRYKNAINRGRIVYGYEVVPDQEAVLKRVLEPNFNYFDTLLIDRDPVASVVQPLSTGADKVEFLTAPPDRVRVRAILSGNGFLALQDNWYPYWKAYSGGKEIPIYRADYTFMALELPAGTHEIELRIENPKYILGEKVTLISWFVLIAGLFAGSIIRVAKRNKARESAA
jgi:hypothetical protein